MPVPTGTGNEATAAVAAIRFRDKYKLAGAPISDLNDLLESYVGIDVAIIKMDQGLDGMLIQDPETGQRIISAACSSSPERQRATLAHELGHIELGDFAAGGFIQCQERTPQEIRADAFARHLLIPVYGLNSYLEGLDLAKGKLTEADISRIVRYFTVSPRMVLIQLKKSGWITVQQDEEWHDLTVPRLAARHGWSDEHHASQKKSETQQPPMRIVAEAVKAYEHNLLGIEAIAVIRNMEVSALKLEFDANDIRPLAVEPRPRRFGRNS